MYNLVNLCRAATTPRSSTGVFFIFNQQQIMEKKQTFNEIIQSETPVLVDFFAEWCGPCKMMSPILKDFASQMGDRVRVIKIDVDKNPAASQTYRIQGVPTLILFQKGKIVWRQSGVVQKKQLEQIVNQLATQAQ
ncbi:thioredoxin [Runella sp. CRIBMP]|nr:thioredoxin [Runella sp. CRIBMP]